MTDFATLFLCVDASGMSEGERALDRIVAKGASAEKSVTGAMEKVGSSGKVVAKGLGEADSAAKRTAAGMQQAAAQATRAGDATRSAAGYTANLASQWNDIAVMIAAGQNPIQLAMQQGSQVSEVMMRMGGGIGALRAIGASFLSMINPMSLATFGVIAFGAAAVQWFTDAGAGAKDFDDTLDDLKSSVDAYKESVDKALSSAADLYDQFGAGGEAARSLYRDLAEVQKRNAISDGQAAADSLRSTIAPNDFSASSQKNAADTFGLSVWKASDIKQINEVISALDDLSEAGNLESQISALQRLKSVLEEAAQADGKFTAEENAALERVNIAPAPN